MGQYAGFIVRIPLDEVGKTKELLIAAGARDVTGYDQIGLIIGLMKGGYDGDIGTKLRSILDTSKPAVEFRTLGQMIFAPCEMFDDESSMVEQYDDMVVTSMDGTRMKKIRYKRSE